MNVRNGTNIACRNHPNHAACLLTTLFFPPAFSTTFLLLYVINFLYTRTHRYMQKYALRRITTPPQQSWDCFKMSEGASVAKFRPLIVKLRMCKCEEKPHTEYSLCVHIHIQAYMPIGSCHQTYTCRHIVLIETSLLLALNWLCIFVYSHPISPPLCLSYIICKSVFWNVY